MVAPMSDDRKMSVRGQRDVLRDGDETRRQAVRSELEALAGAEITDVVSWETALDGTPRVHVTASADLSPRARKAIKKVKVTPGQYGDTIEIEMHCKVSALRLLARTTGLLAGFDESDKRPTLVGINIRGPVEDQKGETDGADEQGDGQGAAGPEVGPG